MPHRITSTVEADTSFWNRTLDVSTDGYLYDGEHELRAVAADTHRFAQPTYEFADLERLADGFRGDMNKIINHVGEHALVSTTEEK